MVCQLSAYRYKYCYRNVCFPWEAQCPDVRSKLHSIWEQNDLKTCYNSQVSRICRSSDTQRLCTNTVMRICAKKSPVLCSVSSVHVCICSQCVQSSYFQWYGIMLLYSVLCACVVRACVCIRVYFNSVQTHLRPYLSSRVSLVLLVTDVADGAERSAKQLSHAVQVNMAMRSDVRSVVHCITVPGDCLLNTTQLATVSSSVLLLACFRL